MNSALCGKVICQDDEKEFDYALKLRQKFKKLSDKLNTITYNDIIKQIVYQFKHGIQFKHQIFTWVFFNDVTCLKEYRIYDMSDYCKANRIYVNGHIIRFANTTYNWFKDKEEYVNVQYILQKIIIHDEHRIETIDIARTVDEDVINEIIKRNHIKLLRDDEVASGYKLLINDLSTFIKEGF